MCDMSTALNPARSGWRIRPVFSSHCLPERTAIGIRFRLLMTPALRFGFGTLAARKGCCAFSTLTSSRTIRCVGHHHDRL